MSDEIEQVLPDSEPAPVDTRSIIEAAVAKQRDVVEPVEAVEATPEAETPEQAEKAAADRARDEKGRFAPKEGETLPVEAVAEVEPEKPVEPAKVTRPPVGWSVAAKAEFDKLPEAVKTAIVQREEETDSGFKRYSGLKPFVEEAEKYGTTLGEVVGRYRAVDKQLESDFLGGLDAIARQFRADPRAVAQAYAIRHGVAQGIGLPEQHEPVASQQQQIDPRVILQQAKAEFKAELEQRETQSAIQAFQNDPKNRFFENVKSDMAALLSTGKAETLQDAYDKACWLNPETRAFVLREQAAQAPKPAPQALQQAKQAAKAVGGAPSPGFNPGAAVAPANQPLRETIRAAIASQR